MVRLDALSRPNFDRIARIYRWLEYITFGSALQQARVCFLPNLLDRRHALLFGDGDGRFLARLLADNSRIAADAVDISRAMLEILRLRVQHFANQFDLEAATPKGFTTSRLHVHHQSALTFIPTERPDLVATHFFLDCLTQSEVDQFISQIAPSLNPKALWVVSEFRIPSGILRQPAALFIRGLYLGFRLLTGLRVTRLPVYNLALCKAGFVLIAQRHRLAGLLTSELWQKQQ